MKLVGDWEKARALAKAAAKSPLIVRKEMSRSTAQAALILERRIKQIFEKGGVPKWKPLSAITRLWHSPANPLSDRSDLRNSIQPTEISPGIWFVGVARNARTKEGKKFTTYRVALVHEFGVWVSPKKKFLFIPLSREMETAKRRVGIGAKVRKIQGRTPVYGLDYFLVKKAVYIPPRPFVGPGIKVAEKEVEKVMTIGLEEIFQAFSKG